MKLIHHAMEQVALEAISFQSPEFGNRIIQCFEVLLSKKKATEAQSARELDDIVELTAKHTGIRLKLLLDTQEAPCVFPPYINPNHIFLPEIAKGLVMDDYNHILSKMEKEREVTYVDLKNCRVGGLYSKIESPMYMGFDFMKKVAFTAREAAAVFMHELGHIFVAYEMTWRSVTTNQIMAALVKSSKDGGDRHEITLKRAGKAIGDEDAFVELSEVRDGKVITTAVMTGVYRAAASEMKIPAYNQNSFEALADQFSTRHGLGRDLVTSLVKIGKHYGFPEHSTGGRISAMFMDIFMGVFSILLGVLAISMGLLVIHAGLMVFMGMMHWVCAGDNMRDHTYDDVKVRYLRVREQIITLLKVRELDPARVKQELANLAAIDKAIDEVKEFKPMTRVLMNFFIPANRRATDSMKMQRDMEELAANDIFVQAAALRAI